MPNKKIDWLKMENEMREELRKYDREEKTALQALSDIDLILGRYTGRGVELWFDDAP